jgi:hypothetical protein
MAPLSELDSLCRRFADPVRAAKYQRYFVEGYDAYGVDITDPGWAAERQAWFDAHRDLGLRGFLDLGVGLFATGKYEHGALAIWFLMQHRDALGPKAITGIGRWFDGGVRNWAHTDVICGELIGPRLAAGAVRVDSLGPWRSSPHKFKRRAVPVSLVTLVKTTREAAPLLAFVRPLLHDTEKVVQQGAGWFLREAWKLQPVPVERVLLDVKDTAPRLVFQYATEKMTPAARARYRRGR